MRCGQADRGKAQGRARRRLLLALALSAPIPLCVSCLTPFEARHESQKDSSDQIWMSEQSQVRLRNAQSRVFDSSDKLALLTVIVTTLQDLGFMIEVLDEELGIVSGTRFDPYEGELPFDPSYHTYDDQTLLLFSRNFTTWGPFFHRADLVRATVTVRRRGDSQLVVRANAQFYLRAVEDAEPYQRFFSALEAGMRIEAKPLPVESANP